MNIPSDQNRVVRIHGKDRKFIATRQVRSHKYFLLEKVGNPFRDRYLAFCKQIGQKGKYFLLQDWADTPGAQQFLNASRKLKLEHFPEIFDFQRSEFGFTCVLTWIDGLPLPKYLEHVASKRRKIDATEAVRMASRLAYSISQLHQHCHIVHGDLHPENIIVSRSPPRLTPIDFGSSWSVLKAANRTSGDGYKPCYAAPEAQIEGSVVGPSSDMFSIFVILYELLTDEIPYSRLGGQAGLPYNIEYMDGKLRLPSDISSKCQCLPKSLRTQLDALIVKGLSLSPEKRFRSSRDCVNALSEMLKKLQSPPQMSLGSRITTQVIEWTIRRFKLS